MSGNITLSSFSSRDRDWLSELLTDEEVRKFLPQLTTDVDKFIHDMEIAEQEGLGKFCIIRLDNIGVGFISIYDLTENPFIFYAMLPEFRNKGYMKQAIRVIEKEYSLALSTVVDSSNKASIKALAHTKIKTN